MSPTVYPCAYGLPQLFRSQFATRGVEQFRRSIGKERQSACLFQPHGGRSQAEGDALLSLVTQGSLQAAIFRSSDLDTTFEKVRASGAEVLQEPVSQPWGARDCAFRDPSGNLVRIAQA